MWASAVGSLLLVGCAPGNEEALTIDPVKAYVDAKAVLLQAADDRDPVTRARAMEALAATLGGETGGVFVQGLSDENPLVRFAAAMAIGDSRYKPALDALKKMAADKAAEPDKRVFCAAIYALYAIGHDEYASELGQLLFDKEREVRMDAAMAMGKMGEESAVGPLRTLQADEQDEAVKLQVTEALALLGDNRSAEIIEAYTKGYFIDLRLAAIPSLAGSPSPRAVQVLRELTQERNPIRVRVTAAAELARLGHAEPEFHRLCVDCMTETQRMLDESNRRMRRAADTDAASLKELAAIGLGWMGRPAAVNYLHPMLHSANGSDRVAAAMSILRLLKAYRPMALPTSAPATQAAEPPEPPPPPKVPPKLHSSGGRD